MKVKGRKKMCSVRRRGCKMIFRAIARSQVICEAYHLNEGRDDLVSALDAGAGPGPLMQGPETCRRSNIKADAVHWGKFRTHEDDVREMNRRTKARVARVRSTGSSLKHPVVKPPSPNILLSFGVYIVLSGDNGKKRVKDHPSE